MSRQEKTFLPRGTKVPDHIVIIPDGDRRWARSRGLTPTEGHRKGVDTLIKDLKAARDWGIHTVTIWGLSTENWLERSHEEVSFLMKIMAEGFDRYTKEAKKDGVRVIHLGRKDRLPAWFVARIRKSEEETKHNTKYILNIALDYGGKDEIVRAVQKIIKDGIKSAKVDKKLIDGYMDTVGQPYPYPDLIIRTSGEQRTSGILLWQSDYAEMYWEDDHFPDFTPEKLRDAVLDYSRRRRRFGGNDAVEHFDFNPEMIAKLEIGWWRLRKIPEGTRLRDYVFEHIRKQYGLSKKLASQAAKYLIEAALEENNGKHWEKATGKLKSFYKLLKGELKLAFEPSIVASLEIKMWRDLASKQDPSTASEAEETAKELYAEVYRISLFQAAKAAHLMVMAHVERNLAERGMGEGHWVKAEDYLVKFYDALKERVA